ncbi:hypothetical protein B0T19DRAFT_194513 [Cercophora scortea]|uniref:Uncharacterized protein n=1 Tax=Cercophora scortea TaxID=314031 RepID=A0AAE0IPA2_9PEZI|nr:hypothetical protein B0T19DRAFT_194513 [Cercophora scortea]
MAEIMEARDTVVVLVGTKLNGGFWSQGRAGRSISAYIYIYIYIYIDGFIVENQVGQVSIPSRQSGNQSVSSSSRPECASSSKQSGPRRTSSGTSSWRASATFTTKSCDNTFAIPDHCLVNHIIINCTMKEGRGKGNLNARLDIGNGPHLADLLAHRKLKHEHRAHVLARLGRKHRVLGMMDGGSGNTKTCRTRRSAVQRAADQPDW